MKFYTVVYQVAFNCCGHTSNFACQQVLHCHRELYIKNTPGIVDIVNCSQHSSQVATILFQYDKSFTQVKAVVLILCGAKEQYSEKSPE